MPEFFDMSPLPPHPFTFFHCRSPQQQPTSPPQPPNRLLHGAATTTTTTVAQPSRDAMCYKWQRRRQRHRPCAPSHLCGGGDDDGAGCAPCLLHAVAMTTMAQAVRPCALYPSCCGDNDNGAGRAPCILRAVTTTMTAQASAERHAGVGI